MQFIDKGKTDRLEWSLGNEKQMRNFPLDKGLPSLDYIVKNWPRTKCILKKYILSNHKQPDLYSIALICLKELKVFKLKDYKSIIRKLSKLCLRNICFNTYHDSHHFKSVLAISCILGKQINLKYKDRLLLVIIALTHDMNHQGRRIVTSKPYYQELKSYEGLEKILFNKIFIFKELKRIKRIFESTFFPVKPENVEDDLEKIILDADILSSLMFGPQVGVKLARRLKQEIRYNDDSEILFSNFLKLLGGKCLYLDYSKKSC